MTGALLDRRARLKLVLSEKAEGETIERILRQRLRERRERRVAAERRAAYHAEEEKWVDIAGALAIQGTDNPADLFAALASGKVQCRLRHPARWWVWKDVPPRLRQVGAISGNRLIGPNGTSLENEHQQLVINGRQWREHIGGPSLEATALVPVEDAATSALSSESGPQAEQPSPSPKKRATKRATIETYAAHQRDHLADTGEYASREQDEAWAKDNGYSARRFATNCG